MFQFVQRSGHKQQIAKLYLSVLTFLLGERMQFQPHSSIVANRSKWPILENYFKTKDNYFFKWQFTLKLDKKCIHTLVNLQEQQKKSTCNGIYWLCCYYLIVCFNQRYRTLTIEPSQQLVALHFMVLQFMQWRWRLAGAAAVLRVIPATDISPVSVFFSFLICCIIYSTHSA